MNRKKGISEVKKELLTGLADLDKPVIDDEEKENGEAGIKARDIESKKQLKHKRSYMLTEDTIDKILELKLKMKDYDYSEIVSMAINMFYEKKMKE